MVDVFISYSRQDRDFVERLHETLLQLSVAVWIDLKDIPPTVEFMHEIYMGIELANNFLFIISPNSVISDICNLEVSHAVELNKRFIPFLYQEVDVKKLPPSPIKSLLSRVNWFQSGTPIDFAQLCNELIKLIETDLNHIRAHTRLLVRAKEWEMDQYNNSYLLQGSDLEAAEIWLKTARNKQPQPTELHYQYINASTKHWLALQ